MGALACALEGRAKRESNNGRSAASASHYSAPSYSVVSYVADLKRNCLHTGIYVILLTIEQVATFRRIFLE